MYSPSRILISRVEVIVYLDFSVVITKLSHFKIKDDIQLLIFNSAFILPSQPLQNSSIAVTVDAREKQPLSIVKAIIIKILSIFFIVSFFIIRGFHAGGANNQQKAR